MLPPQAVEISLEEECAILSIREKSGAGGNTDRCTLCNRLGHVASRCVTKDRLPPAKRAGSQEFVNFISCKCGRAGNLARRCRLGRTGNPADQGVARNAVRERH
jgi:hypothetical protein